MAKEIAEGRNLLGISNTYMRQQPWFEHARGPIEGILASVRKLTVIPYALADRDWYTQKLGAEFARFGVESVVSPHQFPGSEEQVLADAEAVYIGGGDTPLLVANLHGLRHEDDQTLVDSGAASSQNPLVDVLRNRVAEGMPLLGASAGWNVMFGDIRTTNDMHTAPWRLANGASVSRMDALGLFPRHLNGNPHYLEKVTLTDEDRAAAVAVNGDLAQLIDHQGESRKERIARALSQDPSRVIIALREGAYLSVQGSTMVLGGETGGLIFEKGLDAKEVSIGEDLSYLLKNRNS
ncbi:MAG: Type 1 glutamine amidotransferase-like domain-containing protein [Patescibacteria group bacterium]